MDAAALEARVTHLEQKFAELEQRENQSLRAVPEAKQDAREGELLPRRALLTGATYALGAVGLSLMGTRPAEAAIGTMQYGTHNQAGDFFTSIGSTNSTTTFDAGNDSSVATSYALRAWALSGNAFFAYVQRSSAPGNAIHAQADGTGHALFATKQTATGHGVLAEQNSTSSGYAAIAGVTKGAGPGLYGRGEGSGLGVWGQIADAAKSQSAVLGTTEGAGAAIEGNSILGRGGIFKGKKAQIRLVASSATNKPSTGTRGDLFVDSSGRLWYCKTSGSATGWKQLA